LALLAALVIAQRHAGSAMPMRSVAKAAVLSIMALFVFHLTFRAGGYRTLAAILGALAVSIPLAAVARNATLRQWAYGLAGGAIAGAADLMLANAIPRAAYVGYATAFVFCVALELGRKQTNRPSTAAISLAGFAWL